MVGLGVLSLQEAYHAIDFDTITLLLGMMIVVANLRLSGFFRLVNGWVVRRARHPLVLLAAVVLVAGSFSAFFVNDTICLVMTPLVLEVVTRFRRDPVPYLLAIAMASNVGSTATITGNPQNMNMAACRIYSTGLSPQPCGRWLPPSVDGNRLRGVCADTQLFCSVATIASQPQLGPTVRVCVLGWLSLPDPPDPSHCGRPLLLEADHLFCIPAERMLNL
jgi:Citrate transporter